MVPPNSKTKFICFKNKNKALHFKKHLAIYKSNYGEWPNMNMNMNYDHVKFVNRYPLYEVFKSLYIEEIHEDNLFAIMKSNNISIIICHDFNLEYYQSKLSINFTGEEMDFECNLDKYILFLDELIK
jgi:hypothetical protein